MPETVAFLAHALTDELADLEVPESLRDARRRSYKVVAAGLRARLEWYAWPGNDQRENEAAILRRVAQGLLAARWEASPHDRGLYDLVRFKLLDFLEERGEGMEGRPARWRWDTDARRYVVHPKVRALLTAVESDPRFAPFVSAARAQLADEYEGAPIRTSFPARVVTWHPGGAQTRAAQLGKEIGDGATLEARLRDLVRYHRRVGDLPRPGAGGRDSADKRRSWVDIRGTPEP
jgi:hypothetical protein